MSFDGVLDVIYLVFPYEMTSSKYYTILLICLHSVKSLMTLV